MKAHEHCDDSMRRDASAACASCAKQRQAPQCGARFRIAHAEPVRTTQTAHAPDTSPLPSLNKLIDSSSMASKPSTMASFRRALTHDRVSHSNQAHIPLPPPEPIPGLRQGACVRACGTVMQAFLAICTFFPSSHPSPHPPSNPTTHFSASSTLRALFRPPALPALVPHPLSRLQPGIRPACTLVGDEPLERCSHLARQQAARRFSDPEYCTEISACLPAGAREPAANAAHSRHIGCDRGIPPPAHRTLSPRTHPLPPWPSSTRKNGILFCSEPSRNLFTASSDIRVLRSRVASLFGMSIYTQANPPPQISQTTAHSRASP